MFDFRTDVCNEFYDKDTKKSVVELEIDEQLGVKELVLNYEYEECSDVIGVYFFEDVSFRFADSSIDDRSMINLQK